MTRRAQPGFSLVNALAALALLSFGLLGLAGVYAKLTHMVTKNGDVLLATAFSCEFWAVVQANPDVLTSLAAASPVIYGPTNIADAPAPLRESLSDLMGQDVSTVIPNAKVFIVTGPDATSQAPCSPQTGCSVRLEVNWTQTGDANGSGDIARKQVFNFQYGT